jgi:hypothetical protein
LEANGVKKKSITFLVCSGGIPAFMFGAAIPLMIGGQLVISLIFIIIALISLVVGFAFC